MTTAPHVPPLELSEADRVGIGETLERLQRAFLTRDADALEGVYTDDADWVNAFGTVRRGSAEIADYLRGLFADGNFGAGRPAGPPTVSLRPVGEGGAVAAVHTQILGQRLAEGGEIPVRDNFSLHVLQRGGDGRWRVVSEIYSDARQDATYIAGSSYSSRTS